MGRAQVRPASRSPACTVDAVMRVWSCTALVDGDKQPSVAHQSPSRVDTKANRRPCHKQGGRQGLTPDIVL